MEHQTANKVLRKTFEYLEQMLDEKNRHDQNGEEESPVVVPTDFCTPNKRSPEEKKAKNNDR